MPISAFSLSGRVVSRGRSGLFQTGIRSMLLLFLLVPVACTSPSAGRALMDTPLVFQNGTIDPFRSTPPELKKTTLPVLYATDRQPLAAGAAPPGYGSTRLNDAFLGEARVSVGNGNLSWNELRAVSLLKNRATDPLLKVISVTEFGRLHSRPDAGTATATAIMPNMRFTAAIDYRLGQSEGKDVVLVVSDPLAGFDLNIIHAAQLWFYLGFNGAIVVYSRPELPADTSFQGRLAEHTAASRHLRHLLLLLATESDADTVHLVGHNQGALTAYQALLDLKLMQIGTADDPPNQKRMLGQVIFIGPDVDPAVFDVYNQERLFDIVQSINLHIPESKRTRKDDAFQKANAKKQSIDSQASVWLETGQVSLIEAPPAELSGAGTKDQFFGTNAWLSSDILVTLKLGLRPGERGLVRSSFTSAWHFPIDYPERLKRVVYSVLEN